MYVAEYASKENVSPEWRMYSSVSNEIETTDNWENTTSDDNKKQFMPDQNE